MNPLEYWVLMDSWTHRGQGPYMRGLYSPAYLESHQVHLTLGKLTKRAHLGQVDAFLSHSWHDPPESKWALLQEWREDHGVVNRFTQVLVRSYM